MTSEVYPGALSIRMTHGDPNSGYHLVYSARAVSTADSVATGMNMVTLATGSTTVRIDCKAVDGLAAGRKTCFIRRLKEQDKSRQLKCGRARNSGHGKASSKLTVRVSYK